MKKIILLCICLCCLLPFKMQAQLDDYYAFSYDAAGNRIKREFIDNFRKAGDEPEKYTQAADKYNINVFPSPTRGKLTVAVDNFEKGDEALITIYDTGGNLLDKKTYNCQATTMDITNQPAGQYILRVETKKGIKEWVVAKVQ